jgi:hypothetical protein
MSDLRASLRALFAEVADFEAVNAPWLPWAREHDVHLHLSPYLEDGVFYVAALPRWVPCVGWRLQYTLLTTAATWSATLLAARAAAVRMTEGELTAFLAWRHAPLEEPSDQSVARRRSP